MAVSTAAAIAQAESRFDPLALHDNTAGVAGAHATLAEATRVASRLIAAGHSVDLGLMQINSANLPLLRLSVSDALNPCRSLAAGATILTGDYAGGVTHAAQQAALQVALSRYNTGDAQRGFTNGYIGKVEDANEVIVPALDLAAKAASPDPPGDQQSRGTVTAAGPSSWVVFPSVSGGDAGVMFFPSSKEAK